MPDTVATTSWGYRYVLDKGDVVEVGDSSITGFKAHVKTIRGSKWFSLASPGGGTFVSTLNGLKVSFPFNNNIDIEVYPVASSDRLPDGGIEYNVIFKRRFAGSDSVTLDIDWQEITWKKILGLDAEFDQARCIVDFPHHIAPFVITPTSITDASGEVLKTRKDYEVNSYEGTALMVDRIHDENWGTDKPSYTRVNRTHLFIHRGKMTDALGNTAMVEDINMDEVNKTITFELPRAWLRNASYPVSQICGVDPAYTQKMGSFLSTALSGDATWTDYDLTTLAGDSVVAEIIMANTTTGTENTIGVRANGSSLARYVTIHEAEGGGETHCRMFVQTDASGIIEAYHSDISDADIFYVVGYWANITFTEVYDQTGSSDNSTWTDKTLASGASCVHQIIFSTASEALLLLGVRANGSAIERKLTVHEAEAGGSTSLDLLVKADASKVIEIFRTGSSSATFYDTGYFDTGMDFVEKWESNQGIDAWADWDLTAYLDADGRMCDFLLVHTADAATATMGVRAGSDTSTARTLVEHEAESADHTTPEYSGFGMSAQSHTDGTVHVELPATTSWAYFTGYFKPTSTILNYPITCSVLLSVSPTIVRTSARKRVMSPILSATTTILRHRTTTRASNTLLALTPTIARKRGSYKDISPLLSLTTTIGRQVAWDRSVNSNLSASPTISRKVGYTRASDSLLSLAVTIARKFGKLVTTNSGLLLTPTVSRVATFTRVVSSLLSASPTIARKKSRIITTSSVLALTPTVARSRKRTYTISPSLSVTPTVARSAGRRISINSILLTTPTVSRKLDSYRASDSALNLTTTISRKFDAKRAISVVLSTLVTITRKLSSTITTNSVIILTTTVQRIAGYKRAVSNILSTLVDIIVTAGGGGPTNYPITIAIGLTLTTSVTKLVSWQRAVSSNLSLTTTIARVGSWKKLVSTNLSAIATVVRSRTRIISTSTNLSLTPTIVRRRGANKVISSALSLTTTITRTVAWKRAMSPLLSLYTLISMTSTVLAYYGILKYWTGLVWTKENLLVYTGGSWQIKKFYYWDSSAWREIDITGV